MKNYENYIIRLGIHHILSVINETTIPVEGYIKKENEIYYQEKEIIHLQLLQRMILIILKN